VVGWLGYDNLTIQYGVLPRGCIAPNCLCGQYQARMLTHAVYISASVRGALLPCCCSYGFLDILFHHIADTHVAHHLFSQMPHYHAQVGQQHTCAVNSYQMFAGS
jgi:hypothetical protein